MAKQGNRVNRDRRKFERSKPKPGQEGFEPVQISGDVPEVPDVHLFSIGDEKYYMPGFIPASIGLCMLEIEATQGESAGVSYAMSEVLGEEGYQALLDCKSLRPEEMMAIVKIVVDTVLGTIESGN